MAVPYEKLLLCSHIFGIEYPETYVCVLIPTNFHAGVVLDIRAGEIPKFFEYRP